MQLTNRTKKIFAIFSAVVFMLCMATPAFADTNDPIAVVNNLSEFIFGLIRASASSCSRSALCRSALHSRATTLRSVPTVF